MQRRMRLTATQSFRFDECGWLVTGERESFNRWSRNWFPTHPLDKRSPEAVRQMQLRRRKPRVRTEYWR
jgi:hypothetical protein